MRLMSKDHASEGERALVHPYVIKFQGPGSKGRDPHTRRFYSDYEIPIFLIRSTRLPRTLLRNVLAIHVNYYFCPQVVAGVHDKTLLRIPAHRQSLYRTAFADTSDWLQT